jgi:signal transduction histidine kinase
MPPTSTESLRLSPGSWVHVPCRLTVSYPGLRDRTYSWPPGNAAADEEDYIALPIRQGTERIGTIAVERAAVSGLHTQRRHGLEAIANSLGAVVQVSRLGIELERQLRAALAHAEDIAISRRQVVAEMDSERRRIERNLHDGAQHHLVSLRMTLGLVEHEVGSGQLDHARDRLNRLATQIDSAEAVLAETATGVSSIRLAERGLVAALNSELSGAYPPIVVTSHETLASRRFPPELEAAVYFCCLEAVNNARKHAAGASVRVQIREADGSLHFTVRDNGPGFTAGPGDGTAGPSGRGLHNVTSRIAAVGGTISIRSVPGAGTTIEGSVALPRERTLLVQVREVLREARQLYDGSAESEQLRDLQVQLDEPLQVGATRVGDVSRAETLKAHSALRALDALTRSSPRGGDREGRLRYQLERIRSETHELTEIDLLDELRSGTVSLAADEHQMAEQLLGALSADPRARLGLECDADDGEVRQAAGQQLARWQRRASHPATTRAIRDAAEVLVRTCEKLLAHVGTE